MRLAQSRTSIVVRTMFVVLWVCLAAFATGCGSNAIITTKGSYTPIEAKITRSTSNTIYVEAAGSEVGIGRESITDIDHPGNVAATIGGVISAYGVVNIIRGAGDCDTQGAAYCTGVFLPTAIGGSLLGYGLSVWLDSTNATQPGRAVSQSRLKIVPITSIDKTNQVFGATARMAF